MEAGPYRGRRLIDLSSSPGENLMEIYCNEAWGDFCFGLLLLEIPIARLMFGFGSTSGIPGFIYFCTRCTFLLGSLI